jgi:hypothetical protein
MLPVAGVNNGFVASLKPLGVLLPLLAAELVLLPLLLLLLWLDAARAAAAGPAACAWMALYWSCSVPATAGNARWLRVTGLPGC